MPRLDQLPAADKAVIGDIATENGAADDTFSNVADADFLAKAIEAGATGITAEQMADVQADVAASADAVDDALAAVATVNATIVARVGPPEVLFGDAAGNTWFAADADTIYHAEILAMKRETARLKLQRMFRNATLAGILGDGQSLDLGNDAQPPISTTALDYAYSFTGGPRPFDLSSDPAVALAGLIPYAEVDNGSQGETPTGGALQMIAYLLQKRCGINLAEEAQRFVAANVGVGGTSAHVLYTGVSTTNARSTIQYADPAALLVGKTFAGHLAMLWLQGEKDYAQNTAAAPWWLDVEAIRASVSAQNRSILGNLAPPVIGFSYQCSTHQSDGCGNRTNPSLALKALEKETSPFWGRVTSTYYLPFANGLHLTATGSLRLGLRMGMQIYYRLFEELDGVGIRAGQATRAGNTITIPITWLDASLGNTLVTDTSPGSVANLGFGATKDAGATAVTITAARMNATSIELDDDGSATAWQYAWGGGGGSSSNSHSKGHVRDNDPHVFTDQAGTTHQLQSWLPICEGTVA